MYIWDYPQPVLFYMFPWLSIGISLISWKNNDSDIWTSDELEKTVLSKIDEYEFNNIIHD